MKKLWLLLMCSSIGLTSCIDNLAESPGGEETSEEEAGGNDAGESASGSSKKTDSSSSSKETEDKRTFTEIREERKALEKRVAELKSLSSGESDLIAEEVSVTQEVNKIRSYHNAISQLHNELETAAEQWKQASRASFAGVTLPEITTSDGRKFENVEIVKVEEEALEIKHSGGTETISAIQLPVGLRKNILHEATVLATREGN